jgi:hypothetical protein
MRHRTSAHETGRRAPLLSRLLDRRTGYVPVPVLGLSKPKPHLVMRVQIFGPPLWQHGGPDLRAKLSFGRRQH